jgi:alkyl hydroperoxide reductase subunit AhpC
MPSYEELRSEFERRDTQVLGISTDQIFAVEAWAKSMGGLSYPLLSDFWPFGFVSARYGVLRGDSGQAERAVFVVDQRGTVVYVDVHDISEAPPTAGIFDALDRLRRAA